MSWLTRAHISDFPQDILDDVDLLDQERQWKRAVSTPGASVRHDQEGWTGRVVELRGDPVNDGRVLVEHDYEGQTAQRWYSPLDLSPALTFRSAQRFEDTSYWGHTYRQNHPDAESQMDVYRSSDFPHVFLGGEDDIQEAELKAGQPMCKIVDCRDLPEIGPENPSWDFGFYATVKVQFDNKVKHVVELIQSVDCPIYVHCVLGANRSVSVLASALSILTNRSIDDILSEMKSSRTVVSPQDPYYMMALESGLSENSELVERRSLEMDQDFPLVQPGLFEIEPFRRSLASSTWFRKIANQELAQEYSRQWEEIRQKKNNLSMHLIKENPPNTYYEQIGQDAQVLQQVLPMYASLLQWMSSQNSMIQNPQFAPQWQKAMLNLQENIKSYQEQITSSQQPWNPNEHNVDEAIEWYADNGMDIRPVLQEFGIEYEEVQFDNDQVLVYSTPDDTFVYEKDVSITEAYQWVADAEPLNYFDPNPDDHFWQNNLQGFIVYHATPQENAESIMRDGLEVKSETRGMENRNTGSAVFTSDNPEDIDSYGDVVIAIDVGAMQADGYMPYVAQEEPIEEKNLKERLAHQIGLSDYNWEIESGINETTYVFYDSIPSKYLKLL